MKPTSAILTLTLALALPALTSLAQDGNPPADGQRPPPREGGPQGGPGGQRPPLLIALDVNGDGVIDADEIAKAGESLKKLDKNGDGKLTMDELRPQRPGGAGGQPPAEGQPAPGRRGPRPAQGQ